MGSVQFVLSSTMSLGVYIQVPFCQTKCTYCNFHTGVVSRDRYAPYAVAVGQEISQLAREKPAAGLDSPCIDTVYLGGGTPSLLDPPVLASMLDALRSSFGELAPLAEITLEADPETITIEKAFEWILAGFNRISLGVQSFADNELRAAGRMHRHADIGRSVDFLRAAGLGNISMDLIAGLAHQSRESWEASVGELLSIRPEHISIYMLEIDEGSRLGRESLTGGSRYSAGEIPPEEVMADCYESACRRLAEQGYEHYEISNWALPGRRSGHNLKYWRREPYLGLGAGAHSFDGRSRWANIHDQTQYVSRIEQGGSPREKIESVTADQAFEEELFLGLRQLEGIDLARIERDYDGALHGRVADLHGRIARLQAQGLVELNAGILRLATDRLTVSNEILVELLG